MIDMTTLAAPPTLPGPTGNASVCAVGATTPATPSTDGFMQVLEMFLGGSPLPSSLLSSTAIVQTTGTESAMTDSDMDVPQAQMAVPKDLDAATCETIASLLQTLGFQVKPSDIRELSPLDREQLGSALEFVQRNLERGASPSLVAENAALLLPRPWALDDADGSPQGTTEVVAATDSHPQLPSDLVQSLKDVRTKIHASLGQAEGNGNESANAAAEATPQLGASNSKHGSSGSEAGDRQSLAGQTGQKTPPNHAKSASQGSDWMQSIQSATPGSNLPEKAAANPVPKHLSPGGTTSELIGRQVLEKVHLQLGEGHRELKLRLWPEELGEVRLALKMTEGDKVHANMVVENDAVRQAMLDATPQLKEALARHGLDLERLSVSVSQKDAHETGTDDSGRNGRREGGRNRTGDQGWRSADVAVAEEVVLGEDTGRRNGHNTIDLWS